MLRKIPIILLVIEIYTYFLSGTPIVITYRNVLFQLLEIKMKLNPSKTFKLGIFATLLTSALAAPIVSAGHAKGMDIDKHVVKVISSGSEDVQVFVNDDGDKKEYVFSDADLKDFDTIESQLSELDEASRTKIMELLTKLGDEDSKFIELRDADIEIGDAETEVFIIKTGDNEENMHIEIDVQGDGANPDNRFHVAKVVGDHFGPHKIIRKHMRGNGKHAAKMVKKLIKKGEFSQEQLDEIQQLLSEKEAKVD